ncbi:hypothetical protein L7F22_015804 [Adiantum nelumboides]|nr:hypothetical protein [Adiantum nelumboides]
MDASEQNPSSPSVSAIGPRLKLCYLNHAKLFALPPPPQLTFSKLLWLVDKAFPETGHCRKPIASNIELSYSDEDGDAVIIDSEESLSLAAFFFYKSHFDVIKLHVHVKNDHTSTAGKGLNSSYADASGTTSPTSYNRMQPRIPCRHFKAGFCQYGSKCTFLHNAGDQRNDLVSTSNAFNGSFAVDAAGATFPTLYKRLQSHIPCRHFIAGSCLYGSACTFLHNAGNQKNDHISTSNAFNSSNADAPSTTSPISCNSPQQGLPCRHFIAGSCLYGSACKFLHNAGDQRKSTQPTLPSDEYEINKWLATLTRASEHDNICYLSSPEGFDSFLHVLNHPRLPQVDLQQIVSVLTRPKLRTSLLKQDTDKIYNALIGSKFLNMMHSHIHTSIKPTLGCIEPLVLLSEELMSRSSDGWKVVPLDQLKTLVDEADSDSMINLRYILARLLDQRAKKKRLEAVDDRMESLELGPNFRELPIIPPKEQLLSKENPIPLPVNQVGVRYPNVGVYLNTHFRLMQEDCIATLRDGIHELRANSRRDLDIHVYQNVRLAGLQCGSDAMVFRVSFTANMRRPIDWQSAKRLMFGSLLCMSCDNFQTLLWAVVANRTVELLGKSMVDIQLLESSEQKALEASSIYVMAESSAAYFEAYSHVLRNLQRPEMDELPFQEHLIALEPHIREPAYLKERNRKDVFDFDKAFPCMKTQLRTTYFHVLQTWPEWENSLDNSQMSALKHGLTKKLALIQGPPGTGKTFIGLLIVRIMLTNLKHTIKEINSGLICGRAIGGLPQKFQEGLQEDTIGGPILVICYTNHALDQFLEGVYTHEKRVVRVGGRSKSSELEACSLQKLLYEERPDFRLSSRKQLVYMQKNNLQEQLGKCADLVNMEYVTEESLHGIATEEQLRSLFYKGCDTRNVVGMWLEEKDRKNRKTKVEPYLQGRQEVTSSQNPYEALEMAEVPEAVRANSLTSSTEDQYLHGDFVHELADTATNITPDVFAIPPTSKGSNDMKMIKPRAKDKVQYEPGGSTWTEVKARRSMTCMPPRKHGDEGMPSRNEEVKEEQWLEMFEKHTDVWSLDGEARRALHSYWLDGIHREAQETITRLSSQFAETCQKKQEIENEIQLSLLRKAKVVGMTTTAAARNHAILESLQAEIIVVEEAAEVLESHILACLTASTKHLVLIGDHLQLRPAVAVHKLAVKHQLDVSLFERLVKSGVEYVTLEVQRRMRPSISKLISGIYPMLKDHESVSSRETIKGMKSNVFFLNHTAPEEHRGDDELGKVNTVEAQLVVELCAYLVKQQYSYTDITILSMYKGQTQEILRRLTQKLQANLVIHDQEQPKLPRVSSVDDYQGEECKIIILSLVRSNSLPTSGTPGKIGFLAVSNRVCVALSRARDGLFMFGNGELLCQKSELWKGVVKELQQSSGYGDALVLTCQNHPDRETRIQKPSDFTSVPDGGCEKACELQLSCGHACPKCCHPGGHEKIVCPKRCPRQHPLCSHHCQSLCHGFDDCPPCFEPVVKELPRCGHLARVSCSTSIDSVNCQTPCPKVLKCSHKCWRKCGETCTSLCQQLVEKILPCGHSAKLACHIDTLTYLCREPCRQILPDCEHICQGTCGTCKQGQVHVRCKRKCNRSLPCGHPCSSRCHEVCPPCTMPCQKRCLHSRCPNLCGDPCVPCVEPCQWSCMHLACSLLCHELCDRPCCNEPCKKILQCGHLCLGLCGEPCPSICRHCTPGFRDTISLLMMDEFDDTDRFVELQDCGHVFEVSGLDTWMHTEQSGSGTNGISPKQCPECRTSVTRSLRYGNQVKTKLHQIEIVKKRILEFDITNQGIKLLQLRKYDEAVEKFVAAIEGNRENFDAYLGLGTALCLQIRYKEGIHFFQLIVQHSLLKSAVKEIDDGKASWGNPFLPKKMEQVRILIAKTTVCQPPIYREAEKKLAISALVQWAKALSNLRKFDAAAKACQIVLKEEPSNKEVEETLKLAKLEKQSQMEVVEAMMKEVGGRGHWYQCPNGHYYVVGECGGPMQVSKCPDCKATVGGQNHAPAEGNTHSTIDGSTSSAFSDRVGLGRFNLNL